MATPVGAHAEVLALLPTSRRRLGDADAKLCFARMLNVFARPILASTYGILGNFHDAQDVTQESFVKLNAQLMGKRVDRQLVSWLRTVATNAALDLLRKRRRGLTLVPVEAAEETPELPVLSEAQIDLSRQIAALLSKLPDHKRSVFEMRAIDDMTYEEISAVTGDSPDAARMIFGRVKAHIRKKLAKDLLQAAPAPLPLVGEPAPGVAADDVDPL